MGCCESKVKYSILDNSANPLRRENTFILKKDKQLATYPRKLNITYR